MLRQSFLDIGLEMKDAYIPTDRVTGKFYGTAFVNFISPEVAALAGGCAQCDASARSVPV